MFNLKTKITKLAILSYFSLFYMLPALANDPGTGGIDEEDEDPATPIDNWELLLFLVAAAIGIYFVLNNKKKLTA